jgi:trehalose utilization protein
MSKINVTVWNEYEHERENDHVRQVYPEGIHGQIAKALGSHDEFEIRTATLDMPSHGLDDELLQWTDVMIWWGHKAHDRVEDLIAEKVQRRVLGGMGLLVLHSGHYAKPFKRLLGTNCGLHWREIGELERIWVIAPDHPICRGMPPYIEIPQAEMYGERFDIPEPDQLLFISWFEGGEVFRSGAVWHRGLGRIFYFRPGHETYPIYHQDEVIDVIARGVRWLYTGERTDPTSSLSDTTRDCVRVANPPHDIGRRMD